MANLLNDEVKQQIEQFLTQMENTVEMVLFTKEGSCQTCKETKELLSEVAKLNDKLTYTHKDIDKDKDQAEAYGITMTPSFVLLDKEGQYQGVKFNGIPAGHEINSFLSAILDVSGKTFDIDEKIIAKLKQLDKDVNIKVFVTLSCPHCPGAVQNAHRLALLSDKVEGEMIEAQTFAQMSSKFNVSGVPKIVINDEHEIVGNQPLDAYFEYIDKL